MFEKNLLLAVLAILSGALGYYIRYRIDQIKETFSKINEERRNHYQSFINIVIDILRTSPADIEKNTAKITDKLYEFYKKYMVYASPLVINAFGDYFQFLYNQNTNEDIEGNIKTKISFTLLSNIIICMRKDLGLSNKSLGKKGQKVFRALITDFDSFKF